MVVIVNADVWDEDEISDRRRMRQRISIERQAHFWMKRRHDRPFSELIDKLKSILGSD
jgi:hypothetical protein